MPLTFAVRNCYGNYRSGSKVKVCFPKQNTLRSKWITSKKFKSFEPTKNSKMWEATTLLMLLAVLTCCSCSRRVTPTDPRELELMLQQAADEVLSQHSEEMARLRRPPKFEVPQDFMRAYLPGTGVGNREELVIEKIQEVGAFSEVLFSRFLYKRFNSTDYIVGVAKSAVVMYSIDPTLEYFVLSQEDAVFNLRQESSSVIDVAVFIKCVSNTESLYLTILSEGAKTSTVNVHQIVGRNAVWAASIDLGISHLNGPDAAIKIAHVQSSQGGSLTILIRTQDIVDLKFEEKGANDIRGYIKVYYPGALDLVTFTVHGHGYIAVANHAYVDVFKVDEFVKSYMHFDRLGPFSGVSDLESFRLGFLHYLGVAHTGGQSLFTWGRAEYSLKQQMTETDVLQMHAAVVETCRDEVLLILVRSAGVVMLNYDGNREMFIKLNTEVPSELIPRPWSLTSFALKNKAFVIFAHGDIFKAFFIQTGLKPVEDPLIAEGKKVSQMMKDIQDMANSQIEEINRIKGVLSNAVRTTGDQFISSVQYFDVVSADNSVIVEDVEDVIEWEDSDLTSEEYRKGARDLEKEINDLARLVDQIEKVIPDVVRLDQSTVIPGRKVFSGVIKAGDLTTTTLNLEQVAGIDLKELQRGLYRLDKPHLIEGTVTFLKPLTVLRNLEVDGTVNDIDISEEVMTRNTVQISNAAMDFTDKLLIDGDLQVRGKVNGIDISEEVVTLNGTHHVTAHKEFRNGIKTEWISTQLLDGIDVEDLRRRALTVSSDQTISADMTFSSTVHTNDIVLGGTLNGYNVNQLGKEIVRKDKPATITGLKTFVNDVVFDGSLDVHGTVNGLRIPHDLFLTDEIQTVTGRKEFLGTVTSQDVNVSGKINGLSIPNDIVTLTTSEEISSTLYFTDGIVARENIVVEGHVDGVDISEVAKQALKLNDTNEFEHAVFMGPVTITDGLEVGGLVNKVDLRELVKDIVFKDERPIVIKSPKWFKHLSANSVRINSMINGFSIDKDFMKTHGDEIIKGSKTFLKPAFFSSIFIDDGMIDDLNITDLVAQKLTLIVENDEVDNEIEFADEVTVRHLKVQGTLDGLHIPDDIVLKNFSGTLSNKVFQRTVAVNNLVVGGDAVVTFINDVNLPDFLENRISLSEDQTISGDLFLTGSEISDLTVDFVNGVNITAFAKSVMSKTKAQTVTATKEFLGTVSVSEPITTTNVNGFILSDMKHRVLKLFDPNVVSAHLSFGENVTINNLVAGDINGVDVTLLNEDSLKKWGLQVVKGDVIFNSGFHVDGNIMTDTVNGLLLPEDVLLKTLPQTIPGRFTFGNLGITGNLDVNGLVNGLDLSEVAERIVRTDGNPVVHSNITFLKQIHVMQDVEVTGTINKVDLKSVYSKVLRKTGDQVVTGNKIFKGSFTVDGDIDVESVNGVNWKEFLDDVVYIDAPQSIPSEKTFVGDVNADNAFVSGTAYAGLVNGVNLQSFIDEAVFTDVPTNISGTIVFKNPVEIEGDLKADLVNGLRLETDVITIKCGDNGPQEISGHLSFKKIKVFSDVITDKVNSYDLQKLYEDTLLTEGDQTVPGTKAIKAEVIFQKNVYPDMVNGLVLNRDLVTLEGEQTIEGPLFFNDDVFIEKDVLVQGTVNGVDLSQLAADAVYLNSDREVSGTHTFSTVISQSGVEVQGTVNGVDLVAFDRNVTEFLEESSTTVDIMNNYAERNCETIKYLQESLQDSYHALDGFVLHQKLPHPATFVEVQNDGFYLVFLDDRAADATLVHNAWHAKEERFRSGNARVTQFASRMALQVGSQQLVLHTGIKSRDSSATLNGQPSSIRTGFMHASVLEKKEYAIIAALYSDEGIIEVFSLSAQKYPNLETVGVATVGKSATSVVVFEESSVLHLVVSKSSQDRTTSLSEVYTLENGQWQRSQVLSASSSSFASHFTYHNFEYLILDSNPPTNTRERSSIQVYRNSGVNELFELFQTVPFSNALGIQIFQFGDLSQLHLVAWNETTIQVFSMAGESGLVEQIVLRGRCIKDVKPLKVGAQFYLVVGQQDLKTNEEIGSVVYRAISKGYHYVPQNLTYC